MFFKKKLVAGPTLTGVVEKKVDTEYLFWNISDDLGHSADTIMNSSPHVIMSYAYARRVAAAALYIQGLFDKDNYDHAVAMFKAIQQKVGGDVEFQEKAAAGSIEFMQSYQFLITSMFTKKLIQIASEYEISGERLADADLFAQVIETIHAKQTKQNVGSRIDQILGLLQALSDQISKKTLTMWINPREDHWSCEYHFSEDELCAAEPLIAELYELMEGKVAMPTFAYKDKSST